MNRHTTRTTWRSIGLLAVAALLPGCAGYGPSIMPDDRLGYTMAVARSLEEQLLLNIVRLRYGEAPSFVDVSSIVAGYEYVREGSLSGEAHINNGADSFISPSLGLRLTEKPTVTYSPLSGEGFARTVVAPIPPHMILLLLQSGWSADGILNMSVRSISGYRNRFARMGGNMPPDPEFARITHLLRVLQDSGAVDFSVRENKDGSKDQEPAKTRPRTIFLTLRASADAPTRSAVDELRTLLGTTGSGEIAISVGLLKPNDGSVSLYTFSLFQMLIAQSRNVEVPAGLTRIGPPAPDDGHKTPTISVHSGRDRPKTATTAVPYGGHWYWIDGDDAESRVTLMAMTMLYRLLESDAPGNLPVLTIPAG
ncbi:MAG TPA: hypothetical protein VFV71_13360 [Burkholderiales bacterium]|nr:hypothetical protein [Burkholderiales bacterium]